MCSSMHLFLVALMVQSGLAIKCYNCDSLSNEDCKNMTGNSLVAEECNDAKQKELETHYKDHNRPWLLRVSDVGFYRNPTDSDPVEMVCQKLVGFQGDVGIVVRRCQLAIVNCNYSYGQIATQKDLQIEFCQLCNNENECNGSSNTQVHGVVIGGAIALTLSKHFYSKK